MKHVNMDLPMSSILPIQLITERFWQHNKPGIAACCGRVRFFRLPYFLLVVVDLVYLFWMAIYCCVFFFIFAVYEKMEWFCNWGATHLGPLLGLWASVNKKEFVTSTQKTMIMSFNWQQNKPFKLPNVFVRCKALNSKCFHSIPVPP